MRKSSPHLGGGGLALHEQLDPPAGDLGNPYGSCRLGDHRFWAAAFPKDYETFGYDDAWVKTYRNEIDFTMHKVDRFVSSCSSVIGLRGTRSLWMHSRGSACHEALPIETQLFSRTRRSS